MDFTFGIITDGRNDDMIEYIINSIMLENIPNYEILIVGNSNIQHPSITVIPFDESVRPMWITRKKNLITQNAKYANIVYLHDYIIFKSGWYAGQLIAGDDFMVRMDKILNYDGTRYRDWCIWPHNGNHMDTLIGRDCLIPYDMTHLSKYMYISGAYWIAKKSLMLEFPFDENLLWGQGEDLQWSIQVRQQYNFNMNPNSTVQIMKPDKDRVFDEPGSTKVELLMQMK